MYFQGKQEAVCSMANKAYDITRLGSSVHEIKYVWFLGEILIQGHGIYWSGVVGYYFDNLIHWYVIFVFWLDCQYWHSELAASDNARQTQQQTTDRQTDEMRCVPVTITINSGSKI